MKASDFLLNGKDGQTLFVRSFLGKEAPKAVVQIVHGMAEHSGRYSRLAQALTEQGFAVYASDHRGHGRTARDECLLGHLADERGWRAAVGDVETVMEEVRRRHPDLPLFILGHSMGSYMTRTLAAQKGAALAGIILSGSTYSHPLRFRLLRKLAGAERVRLGKRGKSPLLRKLSMESFNKPFEPARTPNDWLSRDTSEVDRYTNDPLCGFDCTVQLWWDLLGGLGHVCSRRCIDRYPKDLPVLLMAGERDSTLENLKGLRGLQRALTAAGMQRVAVRSYPEARHELFNETNRDDVTRDLIDWLDGVVPPSA